MAATDIATWDGNREINYALVEATRPAMYKAMKYWGKKPYNIWSQYIDCYCPPGGVVLDPFAGSAVAAFEAAKLGRKAISFDLNPLHAFIIEVTASSFDEESFTSEANRILGEVYADSVYQEHYMTTYDGEPATVYNYRWLTDDVSEIVLKAEGGAEARVPARDEDARKAIDMSAIKLPYWYPTDQFPSTPSITYRFIRDLGGASFSDLYTRRNLYLLSLMFDHITQVEDDDLRLQLLSAFVQTLHLTTKMVYPRSSKSNRDFSGSWGRADYMIRRKRMEQNPAIVFERSCFGRQGMVSALRDARRQFPEGISINDMTASRRIRQRCAINYGTVDVADLDRYLPEKSVDFIITDPPYAGLVRYLDLSLVWLVWLKHVDAKFEPDLRAEITIKEGLVSREEYRQRLANAFRQMRRVLKDDGRLVVTFHHQQIREWNEFIKAVRISGLKFDKVTHQYNRRSGESNVANPYGTSGSDFYIRLVKQRDVDFTDDVSGLEHFIIQKAIEIVAQRNEPTPYSFIFDGLVPELLQAGLIHPTDSRENVGRILERHAGPGKIFSVEKNNENQAGDIWWFNDPDRYISHPDRPLSGRVEDTLIALLRRRRVVSLDDVLAELFQEYPNGLTPDVRNIRPLIEKYAYPSAGRFKIRDVVLAQSTQHTEMIRLILRTADRARIPTFVGRREQPEACEDGVLLRDKSTTTTLAQLTGCQPEKMERIEWIDVLWLSDNHEQVTAAFEVENSTNFTSALQRASNLPASVPKFMVIPDDRKQELRSIRDPLFMAAFHDHNWRYLTYSQVERLATYGNPTLEEVQGLGEQLA